jgi:hypothetical protein
MINRAVPIAFVTGFGEIAFSIADARFAALELL